MARPSILVRLSGRRHEGTPAVSNGGVKPAAQEENSWRRRPIASLGPRPSPGPKPVLPPSPVGSDASQDGFSGDQPVPVSPYQKSVEQIREEEYPHMKQGTYLDHSGTTIYARSTVERFGQKMLTNLYGNPHSANEPAKVSGDMVDAIREKALHFLGADPRHFDLIFTTNATAAIKLVADSFRDLAEQTRSGTFWYGYHRDAHTSLVGVRELTHGDHHVFEDDAEVEDWLCAGPTTTTNNSYIRTSRAHAARLSTLGLFAYPGQSNLTGRRLPLDWPRKLRALPQLQDTYTLLDAAALAMTSPMAPIFADPAAAPDFVCLSFYKVFGFPDLGGLVVRRDSGHILALRKYFGGGTVNMVSAIGGAWHVSKALEAAAASAVAAVVGDADANRNGNGNGGQGRQGKKGGDVVPRGSGTLHEGLEDGTLPFHSILALGEAIDVHAQLFGSMERISAYTTALVRRMYEGMGRLRYANGQPLCKIYGGEDEAGRPGAAYGDARRQGATVAFNVFQADGGYESYATVEKLANEKGIYVRSGGICSPGGIFTALGYEPWQLRRARSAGHHCGSNGISVIHELPTGVVRASLGAMSTVQDVDTFLTFLRETFIERDDRVYGIANRNRDSNDSAASTEVDPVDAVAFEQRESVAKTAACYYAV